MVELLSETVRIVLVLHAEEVQQKPQTHEENRGHWIEEQSLLCWRKRLQSGCDKDDQSRNRNG